MYLIVGLGNPGEEYAHTRHNAGFDAVDALAGEIGVRYWKNECGALTGKGTWRDHDLVLAKPQSFMNTSGGPVKQLMNTYGVDAGRITKEKMCQLLSENPAKLYGMYPTKGAIAPGSDADIVVMRTGVEDMVTAADQVQNVDYAPFEGRKLTARIESVFLRGTQVVKDHQVVVEKAGKFVKRGKYDL